MDSFEVLNATENAPEDTPSVSYNVVTSGRDPLYLFACHSAWRLERNLKAYQEILAAMDDCDPSIRTLAEHLLHRASPRPEPKMELAAEQVTRA